MKRCDFLNASVETAVVVSCHSTLVGLGGCKNETDGTRKKEVSKPCQAEEKATMSVLNNNSMLVGLTLSELEKQYRYDIFFLSKKSK